MKDPLAFQAVMSMETSSPSEVDKYFAQDDASESARRDALTEGGSPWYDANIHGDFSEDGS